MVSVGSVSVDVVPNARGWIGKLRSQILPEADALGLEIGRTLSARINEALGNAHLSVDVDTAAADAKLAITNELVDRLDGRTAHINVDSDVGAAAAQLGALGALSGGEGKKVGSLFASISASLGKSAASIGPLVIGVSALAAALVPVVASAAGLAAALVLPLAAAGGGIGLGAVLAGFAVKNLEKTSKKIDQLKAKAATLRDPKARAEALKEAADLEKSLTGPQKAFLTAQGHLSAAFAKLQTGKVGDALFAPLVAGMDLLAKAMPALAPVIESVSGAITGLLSSLSKSASGKGFTDFVAGFAKLAGATITTAGKSLALFGAGLFNIFRDFLPLSKSVGTGLTGLGQQFLTFSQKASTKQGIQSFINYVKANGPAVLSVIGNLTKAIINLGKGAAPYGAVLLRMFDGLLQGYNSFAPKLQAALKATGAGVRGIGTVFRAVYNGAIGPFFQFVLHGVSLLISSVAKIVGVFAKIPTPQFNWARDLKSKLDGASASTKNLGNSLAHLPKPKVDPKPIQTTTVAAHGLAATINKLSTGPTIKPKTDSSGLTALQKAVQKTATTLTAGLGGKKTIGGSVKLKVDASQVTTATKATATLTKSLSKAGTSTKLKVNKTAADQAVTSVNKISTALGKLKAKTITVTVAYKAGPKPPGVNAKGTDFWRGGLTWVGEEGPELLDLPTGAKIIANNKTSSYLASGAGRSATPAASGGIDGLSLVGARVEMGQDGFGHFVDGRIELASDFAGTVGRMAG